MNKNRTIIIVGFLAVVMVILIFSIYNINKDKTDNINNSSVVENSDNINSRNSTNIKQENAIVDTKVIDKRISISQRCRGCVKCINIDPEHFTLNQTTGKAEVISQNNLESNNLKMAISMCPAEAITIN